MSHIRTDKFLTFKTFETARIGSTTSGVLTVTGSSAIVTLAFTGNYKTSSFTSASDGYGGGDILFAWSSASCERATGRAYPSPRGGKVARRAGWGAESRAGSGRTCCDACAIRLRSRGLPTPIRPLAPFPSRAWEGERPPHKKCECRSGRGP